MAPRKRARRGGHRDTRRVVYYGRDDDDYRTPAQWYDELAPGLVEQLRALPGFPIDTLLAEPTQLRPDELSDTDDDEVVLANPAGATVRTQLGVPPPCTHADSVRRVSLLRANAPPHGAFFGAQQAGARVAALRSAEFIGKPMGNLVF